MTAEVNNIMFTDEDLMLGTEDHNQPLYLEGAVNGIYVKRILIDPGSTMNLLSFRTLKNLGHSKVDLKPANVTIQGFDQNIQSTMGSIQLSIDLQTRAKFYVIDVNTSYRALLGRL